MSTDPEVDELLGALRADLPTAEDGARLRARLAAVGVLAATATAGSAGAATLGAQGLTVGARIAALSFGAKLAVATAVTVSVGASTVVALRPASEPSPKAASTVARSTAATKASAPARAALAESVRAPAPASSPSASVIALPPARSASKSTRIASVATPSTSAPVGERAAAPSTLGFPADSAENDGASATTLREERSLVDAALIALQAGDYARATSLLDAHAAKYPNGLLRLERERARAKLVALSTGKR